MINVIIIIGLSAAVALLVVRNRRLSAHATMYQKLYDEQTDHSIVLLGRFWDLHKENGQLQDQIAAFPVRGEDGRFKSKVAA